MLLLAAALVALPAALISGCRLLVGPVRTPFPQLAAFTPWAVLAWAVALLLLLAGRWWGVAAAVLVLTAVQVPWVLPTRRARAAAGPRSGARGLRVLTINVQNGQADVDEIVGFVEDRDVDLLAVQECQPDFVARLSAGLGASVHQMPHTVPSNPVEATGTIIWSRWPMDSLGPAVGEGGEILSASVHIPEAPPLTVTGVHTLSPGRGRVVGWNRDLRLLSEISRTRVGPKVMLGDFNASRDHRPFRDLLGTGLVDGAETVRMPAWRGMTWPANRRRQPASVRLDHVLVTPDSVGVEALELVFVRGTDHRGVLAALALGPVNSADVIQAYR